MRDLFQRLNNTGFEVDISTFSKASSHRAQKPFQEIYQKLNELVQKKIHKKLHNKYAICPIDSTIITLTSKLLWVLGHHLVKLFSSLNLATGSPEDNFINFGHDHDYKFGSKMMFSLPTNAVGVMDRGFAGLKFIQELVQENKYFVLRIKNNWKLEFEDATGLVKVGASDDAQAYRVINFCDLETKTEFRLVTNLPKSGDAAAGVYENLTTIGCQNVADENLTTNGSQILPTSERQVRPMTKLEPHQQQEVWLRAVELAGGKVPTGRIVKDVVQRIIERTQVPNTYQLGEVCQILAKDNPELRGKGGYWGIVSAVNEFSCTLRVWDGEHTVGLQHLKSFNYLPAECEQMRLVCDRISQVYSDSLEETVKSLLQLLGKVNRPYLTAVEEKLLTLLESEYGRIP